MTGTIYGHHLCLDTGINIGNSRYMDINDAVIALSALSQETRLEAFRLLIKAGPAGLAAGEISAELDVIQNTMSTHLASLMRAGLIHRARDGRSIRYSADFDGIRDLLIYLLQDCCQGDNKICTPIFEAVACVASRP